MPSRHATYERLRVAVEELATGTTSIQERLREARLMLMPLLPRNFERPDLRQRFDIIIDDLIGRDASNRGERDLLPTMLNDDAVKIAQRIVDLFCEISDLSDFDDDDDLEDEDK